MIILFRVWCIKEVAKVSELQVGMAWRGASVGGNTVVGAQVVT